MGKEPIVSTEEFIRIWQTSTSIDEVVEKTGMKRKSVPSRAVRLRRRGVMLKYMQKPHEQDWEYLARLAKEHAP